METSLQSALTALAAVAPSKDQKAISDAQTQLTAIRAANPTDAAGVVVVIDRVLGLIGNLQSISIDTATARTVADRVLSWWQSRVGNYSRERDHSCAASAPSSIAPRGGF